MAERPTEAHVGGAGMGVHRHICALFNSRDEEYEVLLPFIEEGILNGDKAVHIVDLYGVEDHCCRMQNIGIDTENLQSNHQLEVRTWKEGHIAGGKFVQEEMLALLPQLLEAPREQGFPMSRIIGQMDWSAEEIPGVEDLI